MSCSRTRHLRAQTKITVPAGLRQHGAGRVDARARHQAFIDGALEREGGPAGVAYGREAAHQRALGFAGCQQIQIAYVGRHGGHLIDGGQHGVPVHVDHARHQQFALAVDDLGVGHGFGGIQYGRDFVALDQHLHAFARRFGRAIEQPQIGEQYRLAGGRVRACACQGMHRPQAGECGHRGCNAAQYEAPRLIHLNAVIHHIE
jgi:hypothetical protein